MTTQPWTDNPLDPEDTGNFQRPQLRVLPSLPTTGEFMLSGPTRPIETARLPPLQPEPPPTPTRASRHAREEAMTPVATSMFDAAGRAIYDARRALDTFQRTADPSGLQAQALMDTMRNTLEALDAMVEAVVALYEQR